MLGLRNPIPLYAITKCVIDYEAIVLYEPVAYCAQLSLLCYFRSMQNQTVRSGESVWFRCASL